MGVPVIATNWSGPPAFLDDEVGYLLPIQGLEAVTKNPYGNIFHTRHGHKWASPSRGGLRKIMRTVVEDPVEARARGARARDRIEKFYGLASVAREVWSHLQRIQRSLEKLA